MHKLLRGWTGLEQYVPETEQTVEIDGYKIHRKYALSKSRSFRSEGQYGAGFND